ncbi:hypothetical protein GPECTOR_36g68 [Gonium pectorale]|uniref:Uncharacterized protein n=1 Tax=Gonium pectorale TaxID=33097 RepID=A0A150GBY4_GONPE|nr:hypothetical protein GPECTOR_36g68 [Gonium pectorale]|eukprot:KXZ47344.1 hypothetical protein GPECTOR_36g68 [Gonium pectorale]
MRAILGYPDDASNAKVERVTISLLQTVKYLMPDEQRHLNALMSYKVTSLNRELLPLLDQAQQLLAGAGQGGPAAKPGGGGGKK